MVQVPDRDELLIMQQEQFAHDRRNHSDVIFLGKTDRLKHYGLHYAKYVGRLVRPGERFPLARTVVDTVLVCLSTANTLSQNLGATQLPDPTAGYLRDRVSDLAESSGRFADGCEKTDHLEPFLDQLVQANVDILAWALRTAYAEDLDVCDMVASRRTELAERAFFATGSA